MPNWVQKVWDKFLVEKRFNFLGMTSFVYVDIELFIIPNHLNHLLSIYVDMELTTFLSFQFDLVAQG